MIEAAKFVSIAFAISLLTAACQPETPIQSTEVAMKQESTPDAQVETESELINPEIWPLQQTVMVRDAEMEERINDLMARMTLEEKVGQVIQPDINDVTPEQVRQFNLGSILNGGGSAPDKNMRNTPDSWLALADEFWEASTDTSDGGVGIPVIWGTDAIHGHNKIVGATLFPHNIGLGAANDPDLMYEIGRITALEVLTTGLDWTFAPTIAVVRNDNWGRTYESYSEDPRIVSAYAPRIVEGIQGRLGTDEFLDEDHIIASVKHFVGDGGTRNGIDQGDNRSTEAELRDIHAAAYPPAIAAGVQTVMASYNSFHGEKMHGMKSMLTDVLVGRMGFDGFVVGDWNGHGQVKGCNNKSCPESFNAGLDMFMVPTDWKDLYLNTLEQVQSGVITRQRLDQAVARILRVKMRAGILDARLTGTCWQRPGTGP
jgi:beta-glucosidase